jgi:hypothetical protein
MSVKRILTALRLDKIAAVDRPCQQPATADLIKRAADAETLWKAKYTADDRKEMAANGQAMSDGSYPIKDSVDLNNAIHAVGRGRNNSHSAIRRHIIARAKALGMSDKIPETWSDGGKLAKSIYDAFAKSSIPLDDPDGDEGAQAFEEVLGEQELTQTFWDAWYKGTSALQESLCSIIKDDSVSDKTSLIEQSLKQFADYVETIIPGDVGKSLAAGIVASVGQPGTTTGGIMTPELKKALGLPETATDADVLKAVSDKDAALAKANEELEKAKKVPASQQADGGADDPDADDEMEKALKSGDAFRTPEGVTITKKAVGDATYAVLKSQNDRLVKAESELKKAQEADLDRSFAKRAETLGFGEDFGPTLRKAYGGDAAAQTEVEKRIAALNKQVEEGDLFKNFGHRAPAADSATAELMAKVDEVKKAHPNLTEAQAYTKAYTDPANRELAKRVKAESRAAAN